MTFVGFDLHKRSLTACALDASGAILAEVRQRSTSLEAVLAWLDALPGPVTVGMEATLYWEWLATRLAKDEHAVCVAHAFHVKLIWHARAKTDPIDARTLAELLRGHLFPSIWVPDAATRERRQLLRGRTFLVRERTRLTNRIQGHLTAEHLVAPGLDWYGKGGRAWLTAAPRSPVLRARTHRLLTLHDALTVELEGLDADVKQAAKGNPVVKRLTTMPGVGVFGVLFLQAEIGAITRFHSSHELAAYAGLVPTTRSSGGKTAHGGLGKASNRWRKGILIEIVVTLQRAPGPVGTYYRHLLRAKGKPKAQAAAARTLCCYVYWMMKEGWTYDEWLQPQHTQRSEVRPVQRMGLMASQDRVMLPVTRMGHFLRRQARVFARRRGACRRLRVALDATACGEGAVRYQLLGWTSTTNVAV